MKLLIDWSVLCHVMWHKMASPDYEARTDIEQAEFARNIAGAMLYYQERFEPDETILALDGSKYWRYEVFNQFYAKHTQVFIEKILLPESNQEGTGTAQRGPSYQTIYYMQHDKKTFRLEYHDGMEKYIRTKLKKAETEDMLSEVKAGNIKAVQPDKIPYQIIQMYPEYKGARKEAKWDYTTTRKEFKDMCRNIAKNLAHTFNARVILEDTAEADDIAYAYHVLHPKEDMIFITTDTDWHQMLRTGKFLKFYNPLKMEWVEKTSEQVAHELAVKIISGDSSDGIPGLFPQEGTALIGPKKAEEMVIKHGVPGIYEHLKKFVLPDYLTRNLRLIYLKNCPKAVRENILMAIQAEKPAAPKEVHAPKDYGLEKQDILSIKAGAEEARASDLEEGMYEE